MRRLGIIGQGEDHGVPLVRALTRICLHSHASRKAESVQHPEQVRDCDLLVLSSTRTFASLCAALASGMGEEIRSHVAAGKPLLGICLGMQALFESFDGLPSTSGLGIFEGVSRTLAPDHDPINGMRTKVPQVGWNRLMIEPRRSAVLDAIGRPGSWMYFSHSLHSEPADRSIVVATTDHGPRPIVAAVCRDNVIATQFRPEKSHRAGTRMLVAFVEQP